MIPDNVMLIVKAPNQQIEDQNIECESSWTVRQLKGHLAEVYPSKPKTEEQKIIYSGQLLDDNIILKDILRTYESQIGHTMHLVCTPKHQRMGAPPNRAPEDGVRRRGAPAEAARAAEAPRPETRQNDQNHNMEIQNYLSHFVVNNYGRVPPYPALPNPAMAAMANQLVLMQQAYLQYVQQYADMWQTNNVYENAAHMQTPPPNAVNEIQPQAVEAAAAPPAPAPAAPVDELARPDWLEWSYALTRTAILFSLVYFYSSPFRFLLVVLLCAMGYLHQVGFFRELGVNPAVNNNFQRRLAANRNLRLNDQNQQPNGQNQQQPNGQIQQQPNDQNQRLNGQEQPNGDDQERLVANNAPANLENVQHENQSLLAVTWMIFTSFFTSLVPETN